MALSETVHRRAGLAAALTMAGMTKGEFARQLEVTHQHLNLVLNGRRESLRVLAAVDAFIAQHTPKGSWPVKRAGRRVAA